MIFSGFWDELGVWEICPNKKMVWEKGMGQISAVCFDLSKITNRGGVTLVPSM